MSRRTPAPSRASSRPDTPDRRPRGAALRGLTTAGLLLSADIHLELWAEGFRHVRIVGSLFLLDAVAGLLIALAVLVGRHRAPVVAAVGFGVATLAAFWLSVTVGFLGVHETATGVPQVLAEVSEIVAAVCGGLVLVVERGSAARAPDVSR